MKLMVSTMKISIFSKIIFSHFEITMNNFLCHFKVQGVQDQNLPKEMAVALK